jgi:hypothetical protein
MCCIALSVDLKITIFSVKKGFWFLANNLDWGVSRAHAGRQVRSTDTDMDIIYHLYLQNVTIDDRKFRQQNATNRNNL